MKQITKNKITDLLQWTSKEYEDRVLLTIMHWCERYGSSPSMMQQLLANASINRWFLIEYEKCELQFLKIAEVVPHKADQLVEHYRSCTVQIMAIYPKPLIDSIKRNREFSRILLTDSHMAFYYSN